MSGKFLRKYFVVYIDQLSHKKADVKHQEIRYLNLTIFNKKYLQNLEQCKTSMHYSFIFSWYSIYFGIVLYEEGWEVT